MSEPIIGYRTLNADEIALINLIKEAGRALEEIIREIQVHEGVDMRWISIAQTHLQQGLMALTRAVAKPTTF